MTEAEKGRAANAALPTSPRSRSFARRFFFLLGSLLFAVGMGGLAVVAIVSLSLVLQGTIGRAELPPVSLASHQTDATANSTATPVPAAAVNPTAYEAPVSSSNPDPTATATIAVEASDEVVAQGEGTATPTPSPTIRPPTPTASPTKTATPRPSPTPEPRLPITGLRIESIGLETKVVPARFVEGSGGGTWEVPAFVAGHADHTAGAGGMGNAVLLGHIDSIRSGDVFHSLPKVSMGDTIEVWSNNRRFQYRVVAIWSVPRSDSSVVQPTPTRSISIITCTGQWLPLEQDYSHRLVVRADLVR